MALRYLLVGRARATATSLISRRLQAHNLHDLPRTYPDSRRKITPIYFYLLHKMPYIEDSARSVVNFHNQKDQNSQLEFVRIVNARYESIEGTMLCLNIEVNDAGRLTEYRVEVKCQPLWKQPVVNQESNPFQDYDLTGKNA